LEEKQRKPQIETAVYPGWWNGVAGPLWLLAIAKKQNFNIEICRVPYEESWGYLFKAFSASSTNTSLYEGAAGMSLALAAAYDSQLIIPVGIRMHFEMLLEKRERGLALRSGLAGQGVALLKCVDWVGSGYCEQHLEACVNLLLNRQCADGSWKFTGQDAARRTELTLADGVPGIIWFLLHHMDSFPRFDVAESVIKSCNWLIKVGYRPSRNVWGWPIINKSSCETFFSTNTGIPGLILLLIKAFLVTGDCHYRDIATAGLKNLPDQPHYSNFTLGDGLAGLGELYLEAYKAFKDPLWLQRATWIAHLFMLTFQSRSSTDGYWIMEAEQCLTADLFAGNSGAIHFLMHYLFHEKLQHPLCG
jgi:Lanthionine synthetase C-like protein